MPTICKEDVLHAYQSKARNRSYLLYQYYREDYFSQKFTHKFIAAKISKDLGYPITQAMVALLYSRVINKLQENPKPALQAPAHREERFRNFEPSAKAPFEELEF